MSVTLAQLSAASAGPGMTNNISPNFLSIGDSLMWGQGMAPNRRFRELVRQRIEGDYGTITELAMARSGAIIQPLEEDTRTQTEDGDSYRGLINPGNNLPDFYSPENYARETPKSSLTIIKQLKAAKGLIIQKWDESHLQRVKWILLDGGINDIGITNLLAPARAELDGYSIRCWASWLLEEAQRIEGLMSECLRTALDSFPEATIVVNGYFPIISLYSVASITQLQSLGFIHSVTSLAFTNPYGLSALIEASTAWQAASNHHLVRSINNILSRPEYNNRKVLFARSNIEGRHCLFGPDSWLWGYQTFPAAIPQSAGEIGQILAGASPEDEVISQRSSQCSTLEPSAASRIKCRFASIGHPNFAGSLDYANSIIEVLENESLLPSTEIACLTAARRRRARCKRSEDQRRYFCFQMDANFCNTCNKSTNAIVKAAENLIKDGARHTRDAAKNMEDAANCFRTPEGPIAQAAKGQFSESSKNFSNASDHFAGIPSCWTDTEDSMRSCDDQKAGRIARCNQNYEDNITNYCNYQCNSFTNCNRFRRFDPRRYICRLARVACVSATATARTTCRTAFAGVRETCILAAESIAIACKSWEVVGNSACSVEAGTRGLWEVTKGITNGLVGVAVSIASISGCAFINAGKSLGNILLAFTKILVAGFLVPIAIGFNLGCNLVRGLAKKSCKLTNWAINTGCQIIGVASTVPCLVTSAIKSPSKT